MIAQLTGSISLINLQKRYIIIVVHDVGYKVFVPTSVAERLQLQQSVIVFTYQHIREDISDLYGFMAMQDLEIFEQLISVSGVGPKAALALLSQLSSQELRTAIIQGDIVTITGAPGIGKKIAERLIMELKQALLELVPQFTPTTGSSSTSEVVMALQTLGYSSVEIRSALNQIDQTLPVSEQIKAALAHLSHHGK